MSKEQLNNFYLDQEEPNQACFLALRRILLEFDNNILETIKYQMPCFCYGKKILCYLWKDKETQEPYILFADGNKIDHKKLESGKRARMKIFRVNPNKDIELKSLHEVLKMSIEFLSLKK